MCFIGCVYTADKCCLRVFCSLIKGITPKIFRDVGPPFFNFIFILFYLNCLILTTWIKINAEENGVVLNQCFAGEL